MKTSDKSKKKKVDKITLFSTILIIIITFLSVIAVFYLSSTQEKGKSNQQTSDKYYDLVAIVEGDINRISENDRQLQQLASIYQHDFILLNKTIGAMIAYNMTHPFTYTQQDIDEIAIQAALKIKQVNALINQTYAYDYGINVLFMSAENNYTYYYEMEFYNYFLIIDNFKSYKTDLNANLLYWINETCNTTDPELLQINLFNWEGIMYNDTYVVLIYATYSGEFATSADIDLTSNSYYELLSTADLLQAIADIYEESSNIMITSLICLAVSAVIIAFAVSIMGRKYIWISLIIGAVVAAIAVLMFGLGILYSIQAQNLQPWWWW